MYSYRQSGLLPTGLLAGGMTALLVLCLEGSMPHHKDHCLRARVALGSRAVTAARGKAPDLLFLSGMQRLGTRQEGTQGADTAGAH